MKPVDRVAGKRRDFLRRALISIGGVAAGACSGRDIVVSDPVARRNTWLTPVFSLTGARLTNRTDQMAGPIPGGSETYVSLLFPVSVSAVFGQLYIADAGHGKLFRLNPASGLMSVMPDIRINAKSRVRTGGGGEFYVLDGILGTIRRYSLFGAALPPLQPSQPISHYADFDVDSLSGRVFASDSLTLLLDRIEPVGQVAIAYSRGDAAGPVAVDRGRLFTADASCRCVTEWAGQRRIRRFAAGLLERPTSLAASGGEVYVVDGGDRSISRVSEAGLEKIAAEALGLRFPEQIDVTDGMMYVADGQGRTVAGFRIRPSGL